MSDNNYGKRQDGTSKGAGYFGELKRPDGNISTELSIGVDFGKGEQEVPLIVPTLSREEIDHLLSGAAPTKEIVNKAIEHAVTRLKTGKNPFAEDGEQLPVPKPSSEEMEEGYTGAAP